MGMNTIRYSWRTKGLASDKHLWHIKLLKNYWNCIIKFTLNSEWNNQSKVQVSHLHITIGWPAPCSLPSHFWVPASRTASSRAAFVASIGPTLPVALDLQTYIAQLIPLIFGSCNHDYKFVAQQPLLSLSALVAEKIPTSRRHNRAIFWPPVDRKTRHLESTTSLSSRIRIYHRHHGSYFIQGRSFSSNC